MLPFNHIFGTYAVVLMIATTAQAEPNAPQHIANVIIPASFASALRDGLSVPVYLRYQDQASGTDTVTEESIGNATLLLKGQQLHLLNIDFTAAQQQSLLSDSLLAMLSTDNERPFDSDGKLVINADASMLLDLVSMQLNIEVSRSAFSQSQLASKSIALSPSVNELTSVHRYNLGYSFTNQEAGYLDSNFTQLGSTFGYGAHHLLLDGSLYNMGESQQAGQFYKAMYERDLEDRRIAAGMVSTWDLQTLGMVTALNSGRIYGLSYGNQAQSRQSTANESTSPVQVFMPANGEVRISREGRLIALQTLPIGNHPLDTASFPSGIYNVTVEVYVDGRLIETTTQRVTKLGGGNQFVDVWGWQWWGGWMESSLDGQSDSPLFGASVSRTVDALTFSGTSYAFNDALVGESGIQWQAHEQLGLGLQTMFSSDGSWRAASNTSFQVTNNISLWASQETLHNGNRLKLSESELYLLGVNLHLGGLLEGLGQISYNTTHDKKMGTDRSYLDYYQHLYSGRYGNLSMWISLQSNDASLDRFSNKSLTLDYTLPLGQLFSLGMSSNEQGQTTANLSYQQQLEGVINQASFNAQRVLNDSNTASPALSGTLGFEHRAISGTTTLGRTSNGDLNGNLIARGALATTGDHLMASGKGNATAGLLIDTGMSRQGQMLAKVNGQDYPLQGERSFLALPPYQEYEIELLNSKTSLDSYEINTGKQRHTLFPGNVATMDASHFIREMITVFGVMRAEDGSLITNARLDNHIGTTVTNEAGEFSLDVDKTNPMLTFKQNGEYCEAELDIKLESGAAWVGDVICRGLPTYAMVKGY
ncbi:CS1-pili formation C-terminal domain-containing protein [Aeromonas hydrophila]|uniref:CS1-pili formation C-terminal domain-containing protein n=1 Tax=Aeromonas hydrophila TaxID=644 RepID=UPI003986E3F7